VNAVTYFKTKSFHRLVREFPEEAYEPSFIEKIEAQGVFDQFDMPGDSD
jgi:hypothetical protein